MVEENLNLIEKEFNLLTNLIKNLPASKDFKLLFNYVNEKNRIFKEIRHQNLVIGKPYDSNFAGAIVRFMDDSMSENYDEFLKLLKPSLSKISCLERDLCENNNIP